MDGLIIIDNQIFKNGEQITLEQAEKMYNEGVPVSFKFGCKRKVCPYNCNCLMCPDLDNELQEPIYKNI